MGNGSRGGRKSAPRTPAEAIRRLLAGNGEFVRLAERAAHGESAVIRLDPNEVGFVAGGVAPVQRPFAAVLGCADARVPVEIVFQQRSNELFVARVAGNGISLGGLGSFRYAAAHFTESMRLMVVLGHSQCGAVTAAVDAFLRPRSYLPLAEHYPLRTLIDGILVSVRTAELALQEVHGPAVVKCAGHRAALVEVSVVVNAALAAFSLEHELGTRRCRVVYGRYDLATGRLRLPLDGVARSLAAPPRDDAGFHRLVVGVAGSAEIRRMLGVRS